MTKTIKIRESLYLNIDSIKNEINSNEIKKEVPKNFYMILDVSYSMSWVLKDLKEDLKKKLREIMKDGDTLTLSRFSSEGGQYEYFTVGFRKALDSDFDLFDKKLNEKIVPLGSTCFSEVLWDLPKIVDQVNSNYQWDNIVFFLTDGEPCVSNYKKEIDSIFSNLSKINVDSFVFVWYTNYYNRELLSEMTEKVNGQFIHASEFSDYSIETNKVFENFSNKYIILEKETPKNLINDLIYSIDWDILMNHKIEWEKTKFIVDKEKKSIEICYFTNKTDNEVIKKKDITENEEKYLYWMILQLSKINKRLLASEILSYLWDVKLIDIYQNSLTTIELANFDNEVKLAVLNKENRFVEWKKADYLPSPNKFCLIELFELLEKNKSKFDYSKMESYNSTTANREIKNKEVKFERDWSPSIFTTNWNQEELNLSIKCKIDWKINIENVEWYKDVFPKEVETYQFRNYSVISDWKLNMNKFPVIVDEDTFNELKKKWVISQKEEFNESISIDLTKLPIINRKIAEKSQSFKEIAEKQTDLEIIKAKLKVINSFLPNKKDIYSYSQNSDEKDLINSMTIDEINEYRNLLSKIWIVSYWYSPSKEKLTDNEESKDYRIARTFKISVKWFSSLPKIEELDKKKDTLPVIIMKQFKEEVENNSREVNLKLRDQLENEKDELVKEIRSICFAIILWRTKFENENSEYFESIETKYWINWEVTMKFSQINVRMK